MKFYCDEELLCEFDETDMLAMKDCADEKTLLGRIKSRYKEILVAQKIFYRDKFFQKHRDHKPKESETAEQFISRVTSLPDYKTFSEKREENIQKRADEKQRQEKKKQE